MIISSSRWQVLKTTLAAWNKTEFPFLSLDNSGVLAPLENNAADDPGLNYFVPWLAKSFTLPLEHALWWWDCGLTFFGAFIAFAAFWCLSKTKLEKSIAFVGVSAVAVVSFLVGDVYIAPFFNICLLPWLFVVLQNNHFKKILLWAFCAGLVAAFTNFFRMYTGFPVLIAGIIALCFTQNSKKILLLCLALCIGMGVFECWFKMVMHQRNAYLKQQDIAYGNHTLTHIMWHSTYLGLGFLQNEYGIYYGDDCGLKKAQSIDPDVVYCSNEYNQILKQATITTCLRHPHFVLRTLFAKGGVLLYYLFLCANIGLLCAWFYRKPWWIECSYLGALVFSSLSAIATIPIAPYLTGFFAVATFYGIHSIIYALQKRMLKNSF